MWSPGRRRSTVLGDSRLGWSAIAALTIQDELEKDILLVKAFGSDLKVAGSCFCIIEMNLRLRPIYR